MIGRRGALLRILTAPFAASGVASQAGVGVSTGLMPAAANSVGPQEVDFNQMSEAERQLRAIFDRHSREAWRKRDAARDRYLPHHIESKKSWSPAFKAHVALQEDREWDFWNVFARRHVTEADMLADMRKALRKAGVL